MRVLIWHHKHGDYLFNASTKAKEQAAMQAIFKTMDGSGFYFNEERTRLERARAGDSAAIAAILHERDRYEYEEWEVVEVNDPDAEMQPWDIDCTGLDDYQNAAHGTAVYPPDAGISYIALGLAEVATKLGLRLSDIAAANLKKLYDRQA